MDGQKQTIYPRKNWSAFHSFQLMIISQHKKIIVEKVNKKTGAFFINLNGVKMMKLVLWMKDGIG